MIPPLAKDLHVADMERGVFQGMQYLDPQDPVLAPGVTLKYDAHYYSAYVPAP